MSLAATDLTNNRMFKLKRMSQWQLSLFLQRPPVHRLCIFVCGEHLSIGAYLALKYSWCGELQLSL